jgi:hypothetical protein
MGLDEGQPTQPENQFCTWVGHGCPSFSEHTVTHPQPKGITGENALSYEFADNMPIIRKI